jgi:RNA polymerase sigma-70 factor, ECF subfamily
MTSCQEPDLINALVVEFGTALKGVAWSLTRNVADAEDAVQETFLRVLRHVDRLAEVRDYRRWLIRITWNVVLDGKRRLHNRQHAADFDKELRSIHAPENTPESQLLISEGYIRILRAVESLPAPEREVFLLSAVEGQSSSEIAQGLGTTESAIRSRLYRARALLKIGLDRENAADKNDQPDTPHPRVKCAINAGQHALSDGTSRRSVQKHATRADTPDASFWFRRAE